MKKLITIACCFAFVAAALTGCRSSKNENKNDMNNAPTTVTTTVSTAPNPEVTQPSTIPDSGYMPDNNENNDIDNGRQDSTNSTDMNDRTEGNADNRTPRSNIGIPSTTKNRR
jgi:hypothetical protein